MYPQSRHQSRYVSTNEKNDVAVNLRKYLTDAFLFDAVFRFEPDCAFAWELLMIKVSKHLALHFLSLLMMMRILSNPNL